MTTNHYGQDSTKSVRSIGNIKSKDHAQERTVAVVLFTNNDTLQTSPQWGVRPRLDAALHTLLRAATAATLSQVDADVVVASNDWLPTTFVPLLSAAGRQVHHIAQRGETFGDRLRNAAQGATALGYERVVLIGDDTPELSPQDIRDALDTRDVVLGPSVDGGVYLIGLESAHLCALEHIPWRTNSVFSSLLAYVSTLECGVSHLRTLGDLDTVEDAVALAPVLRQLAGLYLGSTGLFRLWRVPAAPLLHPARTARVCTELPPLRGPPAQF